MIPNSFNKITFLILGITAITFLSGGIIADHFIFHTTSFSQEHFQELRQNTSSTTYQFINPLLGCQESITGSLAEFVPLRTKINDLITNKISHDQASTISVYLDLRDGRWLGINTEENYSPASLIKVAVMIALFKEAEADPGLLQKKILYDGSFDYNTAQNFKPEKTLTPHQSYTLNELNERMIAYSDNNAVPLLSHYIDDHKLRTVFSDLGVFIPTTSGELNQDFISVKAYANFFRVLYNASYLNRDLSEKALSVLSKSDFPQGITAGVPTSTIIVQKFGERKILDINNNPISTELHDCGIIYAPAHPYLLCIMTKGKNFNELAGSIKDISKLVYDSVQNGI